MSIAASRSIPSGLNSTKFTRLFEKRLSDVINDCELIDRGARVLVAVSGGADSTALLVALSNLKKTLGIEVGAAHFDHRLRGRAEAAADVAFVRRLIRVVGAKVQIGSGDVKSRARRKRETIEEAARGMRYNFLRQTAKAVGCSVVAVAHNRNDQAETVLMRIIRGAGLDGIAGMRRRLKWPFGRGPALVRPLLDVPRADIDRYCRDLGIEPRHDPTNKLPIATRNRIRNELVPLLRTFNPRIERGLAMLADVVALDAAMLNETVDGMFRDDALTVVQPRSVQFVRRKFRQLPSSLASRLLKRAYAHLTGASAGLESVHMRAVLSSLGKRRGSISLPQGLIAWTTKEWITIGSQGSPPRIKLPTKRLRYPGDTNVSTWQFQITHIQQEERRSAAAGQLEVYLDADAVKRPLTVRSRRPGDRMRPLGLGGTKKVQDILVDAKVSDEERGLVPIICDRSGLIWVVGHRLDERVAIGPRTQQVIHIRALRLKNGEDALTGQGHAVRVIDW